jgi:GAF domain-containing protein
MLARNHQLAVGIEGIVGYVTGSGEPRVALDVGADATFFNNPDLPETRSEMALPLRARGEIIGALDVQSKQAEAFSEDDVEILQTMADQLAVAITNARLFEQAQSALEATRQAYGELSQEAWSERLSRRKNFGYFCDEKGVTPLDQGQFTPSEEENGVAIPLTIRGKTIGTLMAYKARENAHWSSEEVNFIDTLTERMGDALESARLFQDTQKRAIREQLTSQVSAQFRRSLDMETVLKTAAEEIRKALDLEDTIVQLVSPEDTLDMETSQPHPGDDHA